MLCPVHRALCDERAGDAADDIRAEVRQLGVDAHWITFRDEQATTLPQTSNMLIQMGLDTVEIVLRTEETFNIDLPDEECGRVVTVGDLYRLVLSKLNLPYVQAKGIEAGTDGRNRSHLRMPSLSSWLPPDVWRTLKGIIVDQLQVEEEDVKEEATFLHDLGSD